MTQEDTNEMIRAAVNRVRASWVECQIYQLHADASAIEAQLLQLERRIKAERALRDRVASLWGRS